MSNEVGSLGEKFAQQFLRKLEYEILTSNFLRKWGEIDIVAIKKGVFHFIEVKTITRYICNSNWSDDYRAEDNIHFYKRQRLARVIQTFLLKFEKEVEWKFDVIVVVLNKKDLKLHKLDYLENIIL